MPKTWRVVAVTNSPKRFKIRMRDSDDPRNSQNDLAAEYETAQDARRAIDEWRSAKVDQEVDDA